MKLKRTMTEPLGKVDTFPSVSEVVPGASGGIPSASGPIPAVTDTVFGDTGGVLGATGPTGTPSGSEAGAGATGPTVDNYKMYKNTIDHIYECQNMYIGDDRERARTEIVFNLTTGRIEPAVITVAPGVHRLFLEILMNASDASKRARALYGVEPGPTSMTFDRRTITIRNVGPPIPVEIHPESLLWTPQMIFGTLYTSSNYGATKVGVGVNGYGAKLTNIFSKKFIVRVWDALRHKFYEQTWTDNMSKVSAIEEEIGFGITPYAGVESAVEISYEMDFERFSITEYSDECFFLFARDLVAVSMANKIPVSLNGRVFDFSRMETFAQLCIPMTKIDENGETIPLASMLYDDPVNGIEMLVVDTPGAGKMISVVNGMIVPDGGFHVDLTYKALAVRFMEELNKDRDDEVKTKAAKKKFLLTPEDLIPHLSIVLSIRVIDPVWGGGQNKTSLVDINPDTKLTFNIPKASLDAMFKWEVATALEAALKAKDYLTLMKGNGKKTKRVDLDKGEDAHEAGGKHSHLCTLIIVEGDSARGYPDIMISCIPDGKRYYGLLPLRGKMLNIHPTRATTKKIDDNKEIKELRKMLGLDSSLDYLQEDNRKKLRYGQMIIMTDADPDGDHITALAICFLNVLAPTLLAAGFLKKIRTPLIRYQGVNFFSDHDFEVFCQTHTLRDKPKYLKGLGSSKKEEIKADCQNKTNRQVVFIFDDRSADRIDLAFSADRTNDRKAWMMNYADKLHVQAMTELPISYFVDHELIEFSLMSVTRAIPSLLDGFKRNYRQIFWVAYQKWKRGVGKQTEMKVSQLSGLVSSEINYHHGETSLMGTTIIMAQDFVGANNLPYFVREGLFGSRKLGGKDAASPRYIFTHLEWWVPLVYKQEDEVLLTLIKEEGQDVEPEFMLPTIPMCLVNGSKGIATGWSTFIPNHNPRDLIRALKDMIMAQAPGQLIPWYRGFTGHIRLARRKKKVPKPVEGAEPIPPTPLEPVSMTREEEVAEAIGQDDVQGEDLEESDLIEEGDDYVMMTTGRFEVEDNVATIVELPIREWTTHYVKTLEKMRKAKIITDHRLGEEVDTVRVEVMGMSKPTLDKLKLRNGFSMDNMYLLNQLGRPVKYRNSNDILKAFFDFRYPFYQQRKDKMIEAIDVEINRLDVKARFIEALVQGTLVIIVPETRERRAKADIEADMARMGFPKRLLSDVRIGNQSSDDAAELRAEIESEKLKKQVLADTHPGTLWIRDLDELEAALVGLGGY